MLDSLFFYMHQIFHHPALKAFLTTLLVLIEFAIGWFDQVMQALLMLIILDFLMWFAIAWRDHKVSRHKMMTWLYKMMIYCGGIMMGHWTDILVFHHEIEFGIQNIVIVYLGVNEALSIIKHMNSFWVKMPIALVKKLESYRDNINLP